MQIELALGQPFPAGVAPALEPMRPDATHDPTVESVEEPAHVGLMVFAPILISFSRSMVSDQCFTSVGSANFRLVANNGLSGHAAECLLHLQEQTLLWVSPKVRP